MPASRSTTRTKGRRGAEIRTFLVGLAALTAAFLFNRQYPRALEQVELKLFDVRNTHAAGKPRPEIVIAAIDDKSVAELGHWPWSRAILGELVSGLADYKAAVVGFDLAITEPDASDVELERIAQRLQKTGLSEAQIKQTIGPSNDEALALALKRQGSSYMGFWFHREGHFQGLEPPTTQGFVNKIVPPAPVSYATRSSSAPPPLIHTCSSYLPNIPIVARAVRGQAYFNVDIDPDGVIRSEIALTRFNGNYYAPLILAVTSAYRDNANLFLDLTGKRPIVRLGDTTIPVDEAGRMLVNFRGGEKTFPHLPAVDIIKHRIAPSDLNGKIVLVGVTGRGLGDRVDTPVGNDYPGVEFHANAIDTILTGDFVQRSLDVEFESYAALLLGILISLAAAWLTASWSAITALALGATYFMFAQYLLFEEGVQIGVLFPLAAMATTYVALVSYRYVTEGLEKRHLRNVFEHYLHPEVIQSVVDDPDSFKLGGERRHLSILFADIINFTSRAESSNAEELVALLNVYMTRMTDLILQSGGVVDKLMGDGIMAFWGAPAEVPNTARSAIDCALAMLRGLGELRQHDERFKDLDIGIGIATGEAIVGNFGGERRFDYSVIGDVVNLASRVEGLTRQLKVHLLVTRETYSEAGDAYIARGIGLVKVKGKQQAVAMVEVIAHARDGVDPGYLHRFEQVLSDIRSGSPAQAYSDLSDLAQEHPDDRVVQLYLERIASLTGANPAEIVLEFDSK
jgi:adenylate cyclase